MLFPKPQDPPAVRPKSQEIALPQALLGQALSEQSLF